MKYLEFTFHTTPCTEIVNDVLSAVLGEAGFESFVEQTDGIAAYIQKDLYNETVLKEALADFPILHSSLCLPLLGKHILPVYQVRENRQELL